MNRLRLSCGVAVATLLLSFGSPLHAQLTEAALKGKVTDASGGVIPECAITATNEATGQARSARTDAAGAFHVVGLPPGLYTVSADSNGFQPFQQRGLKLGVGETTAVTISLPMAQLSESVDVTSAAEMAVAVSTEGRVADNFGKTQIDELPLAQRDIFLLPKLSAGATQIPGSASSTKLSSSPVVTVNGNRYRGNNYVLDGAMNTNPNNTGEPAIVPSLESVEEVQVQTLNFASEFGRGNGAVINIRTKSGTNDFHGRAWEYHRNAALNATNYFATEKPPQVFNQFGANFGGPLRENQTFFFVAYEGTRNAVGRPFSFVVETPEFRDWVFATRPDSVAAELLRDYPAVTPAPGTNGSRYLDQRDLQTPQGLIPAIGRANVTVRDYVRFDQYMLKVDHTLSNNDRLSLRWIGESQRDNGGTQVTSQSTLGAAMRGQRGPFDGFFSNLNAGYTKVMSRAVNDLRISYQSVEATRGNEDAVVPGISITGLSAGFGDSFRSTTELGTLEVRDIFTLDLGRHSLRMGVEARRFRKGLSIGPASAGSFFFTNLTDFANDRPFRQTLTVDPATGEATAFPRYFTQYETGAFIQDQWTVSPRLSLSLGLRHDYFGTVKEDEGRLSSIILGPGATFQEQIAGASIGRVDRLYSPEKKNFSPRLGLAWDPTGKGETSIRAGFSLAFQPHHGQSISGARALPPDAVQGVSQPANRIGTRILYDIPVPFNPEFGRGLNAQGGMRSLPGEPPIRTTGFVVNPDIKTQYTESWFLNAQQRLGQRWIVEVGYVGTHGVNLERIDDVNRFSGDLLDGREDRLNPNFGVLLFVTNGVTSNFHAFTGEVRREMANGFSLQANYRWSKWTDTASDTSTGQFQDNSEPGKGAQDITCLQCERGPSLFDIPHRFTASATWAPKTFDGRKDLLGRIAQGWQLSAIVTAQSGRPFSVWNGAAYSAGGDYNADGGGGAVGGGFYDRPDAPSSEILNRSFSQDDYLNGLFVANDFPKPAAGKNGTLGRNAFRGPRYRTVDLALARSFKIARDQQVQLRVDVYNALNTLNLFLPNADMSLATFGKSTQAFDPRQVQLGVKYVF